VLALYFLFSRSLARLLAFCLAAATTEIALFVRLQFLYNIHESPAPLR
jgi:hypothetical protein